MTAAAQHLPGESRHLLLSIFENCAAPCEAHALASLVASVAGCQLHSNLLADIDERLKREHAAQEADAAHAEQPRRAESVTAAARRTAGAMRDSVQATVELASAVAGGEASAVLASDVRGGAARAGSECGSERARNRETARAASPDAAPSEGRGGAPLRSESVRISLERADSAAVSGGGAMGSSGARDTAQAAVGENVTPAASSEAPEVRAGVEQHDVCAHPAAARGAQDRREDATAAGAIPVSDPGGEGRHQRRAKRAREADGEAAAAGEYGENGATDARSVAEAQQRGHVRKE